MNKRLKELILPEDDKDMITDKESTRNEDMMTSPPKSDKIQPSGKTSPFLPPTVISTTVKTGQGSPKLGRLSPKTSPSNLKTNQEPKASGSVEEISKVSKEGAELEKEPKLYLLSVLAVLIPHMRYTAQETRKETLRWIMWLHQQLPKRVCPEIRE